MKKLVIIGAGIYGSLAKKLLTRDLADELEIIVVDCLEAHSASKCALGLMKPSWMSAYPKKLYGDLIKLLDDLCGVEEIQLNYTANKPLHTFHRVNVQDDLLETPDIVARVLSIDSGKQILSLDIGTDLRYDYLYVANGYWASKLLPDVDFKMEALWGVTHLYDKPTTVARIAIYQPFKQAVSFPKDNRFTYFLDGKTQTTTDDNFTLNTRRKLTDGHDTRAEKVGLKGRSRHQMFGIRPKAENYPDGVFLKVAGNAYCGTGGAKNGTLAAMKAAIMLKEAVQINLNQSRNAE